MLARVEELAARLGARDEVELDGATEARAAAMVITAAEGAQFHLDELRARPAEFDRMTRCRFIAGALVPASDYLAAQRYRRWFRRSVARVFEEFDVLITATTPFPAPLIGQREAFVDGQQVLTQPYLGVLTQPISFIGLPALSVPAGVVDGLPVGAQLITRPWDEHTLFELAGQLETGQTTPTAR